jgi:hypothetical protein
MIGMVLPYNEHGPARKELLLEAGGRIAIALISSPQREWREPGLAPNGPQFIGRHELVGRIESAKVHFDLVASASEDRRAAAGTEEASGEIACLAIDSDCGLRKYRGRMKERSMVLAAVETVAKTDPVGSPRRPEPDFTAQAASGEFVHFEAPCRLLHSVGATLFKNAAAPLMNVHPIAREALLVKARSFFAKP